tara:strand:+ start:22148 stop:23929 length:1782 start_codon:yes stop_codon:yes gene_type:complete
MNLKQTILIGNFGSPCISSLDIAEEKYRVALETFSILCETDTKGNIIYANRLFCEMYGYELEELIGSRPHFLDSGVHDREFLSQMRGKLARKEVWHGEICNQSKSGELHWLATTIIPIISPKNSQIEKLVSIQFDVTDRFNLIQKIDSLARYDPLTELPNRTELAHQFEDHRNNPARYGTHFAVAIVNLDDFKSVNDAYGQHMGDELLIQVAERIKLELRPEDVVARIGGDEFALILCHAEMPLERVFKRLLSSLKKPFVIDGMLVKLSASIGIRLCGDADVVGIDQALRHASIALYRAKSESGDCYRIFDCDEAAKARKLFQLHNEIHNGFTGNEFEAYFQPIVHLATSKVVGFESLLRWRHPVRGLLLPREFLPTIENDTLIIRVGEWMLRQALKFSQTLFEANLPHLVSVNIAALHLQHPAFVGLVKSLLQHHSILPPGSLTIEITESAALTNIRTATNVIMRCKKLGVKFALDDFGTGFSPLTYLRQLPIDGLKIDRLFTKNILINDEDLCIVRIVAQLSEIFGLRIVAEGIENSEQAKVLRDLNCEYGQGFGIAPPMPAAEALAWAQGKTSPDTNQTQRKVVHRILSY